MYIHTYRYTYMYVLYIHTSTCIVTSVHDRAQVAHKKNKRLLLLLLPRAASR